MSETVQVVFQYAIGQRVRWKREPHERWRVLERWYLEGQEGAPRRYLLITASDTWTAMAEEGDLTLLEDVPCNSAP